ncbi:MAG: hypothetical protein K6E95_03640 [Lachnospiraceae bacterium]|nr:hypothetical protein [Lachnospiraceae bacterium]
MIRRNRFEVVGQSLIMAAGVILAVIFVSIMIMEFENSRKLSDAVNENILDITETLKNSDVMMYDGVRVRGADVLNFGKKFFYSAGEEITFVMKIVSKSGRELRVTDREDMVTVVAESALGTDPDAIDPLAEYIGIVSQNENGIITEVSFRCV